MPAPRLLPTALLAAAALAALSGCAPRAPLPATAPAPPGTGAPPATPGPSLPIGRVDGGAVRFADPATAYARGWMPLDATRVPAFSAIHPAYDGRGVIIAILDSGIEPGVAGLETTSTGAPKLLDLRDFSGEGRVQLEPIVPVGDTVVAGSAPLLGGGALRALSPDGPWYVGRIAEHALGAAPAADVNGDGDSADTLAIVVAMDAEGWFAIADTDLDETLEGEVPVRDYAVGRGYLAWSRGSASRGLRIAVNLGERAHEPVLDLYFDTSGHGTHVAGIAAGHRMYEVDGFDGVAPGAQLLGLKISNNAHGAVSTTGSMLAAVRHAIDFAAARQQPLVLNLSFGVGNEREGGARIDALIDSVLQANPALVFTISAGNDGPGLSTVGFPGSAARAISVGATFPSAFVASPSGAPAPERPAHFSARGGELAKPDLLAPGVAYSTVPAWNAGRERSGGTSMASPHAAGLAARLLSGIAQEGRHATAADVRAALVATARSGGSPVVTAGAGVPDLPAAWAWLASGRRAPDVEARAVGSQAPAVLHRTAPGTDVPRGQTFELRRPRGAPAATYRLRADVPWLAAPDSVIAAGGTSWVPVRYDAAALAGPGVWTGSIAGWGADSAAGPLFRLVNTVVTPHAPGAPVEFATGPLEAGAVARVFFGADTGRAFRVSVRGSGPASAFLHEPGGRPYRDANARPSGTLARPTVFEVDASDVEGGAYELVVAAPSVRATSAAVSVRHAPVRLAAARAADGVHATITAAADSVTGEAMLLLVGAERRVTIDGAGDEEQTIALTIPDWARSAAIDVRHPAGQWDRFTDFGVTLFDDAGTVIEQAPLNYAFGRLAFELDAPARGRAAVLSLLPGFADGASTGPWNAAVSIRFYAPAPVAVAPSNGGAAGGTAPLALAPGAAAVVGYPMPDGPWPLGEGFHSLAVLVAEIDGVTWSREIGLGGPAPAEPR